MCLSNTYLRLVSPMPESIHSTPVIFSRCPFMELEAISGYSELSLFTEYRKTSPVKPPANIRLGFVG